MRLAGVIAASATDEIEILISMVRVVCRRSCVSFVCVCACIEVSCACPIRFVDSCMIDQYRCCQQHQQQLGMCSIMNF